MELIPRARSAELGRRRETEEKGPFGRSTRRRGFSRSKTATPARKEDAVRLENLQNEDAIFSRYMQDQKAKEPPIQQKTTAPLSSVDPNTAANPQAASNKEPTEVILYGFGVDSQWAAIEYYERVSGGCIYEDYDRHPPHQRYDHSLSFSRAKMQRNLSQAALKKRNAYRGGDHWIKVTFDSPEAADLACHCSPHAVHGFLVYAEPYRGTGPPNDAAIPYSNAGAQIDTQTVPKTFSTANVPHDPISGSPESSNTMSSATATDSVNLRPRNAAALSQGATIPQSIGRFPSENSFATTTALQERPAAQPRASRLPGATRAVLLPAEQAFLPAAPRYTGILSALMAPFGGKSDLIGSQVPRKEDGTFDWVNATFYWCFFAWLDSIFGTDMCGLKGDD